jgi:hypothetical protein
VTRFVALVVMAMTLPYKMSNSDISVQLSAGRYIVEQGTVPDQDPFSFRTEGRPYLKHEWMACLLFWGLYQVAGV